MTEMQPITTPPPQVLHPYIKYMDKSVEQRNPLSDICPLYSFKFRNCTLDLQREKTNLWIIVLKTTSIEECKKVLKDYPKGVVLTRPGFKDANLRTYRYDANDEYIAELLSRLTNKMQ